MKLEKQCKNCEFNFDNICAGHGSTYKYGEEISDITRGCEEWGPNLEYFNTITSNAPRFLREKFNDCQIDFQEFLSLLENYEDHEGIPINIFDAIKYIYGISMVDIAVLSGVSFGVVYRAKTKGIPVKRIKQFSDALCIPPELLTSITTQDFDKLIESKNQFWSQPDIKQHVCAMPEWKLELANIISVHYLHCPIHIAKEVARVDKVYWTAQMPMDGFTESEIVLIEYFRRNSKKHKPAISIEYSLDLACKPHMRVRMYNQNGLGVDDLISS